MYFDTNAVTVNTILSNNVDVKIQVHGVPEFWRQLFSYGTLFSLLVHGTDYLTVNDLIEADGGMYQARASNAGGDAEFSLELIITEPGILMTVIEKSYD